MKTPLIFLVAIVIAFSMGLIFGANYLNNSAANKNIVTSESKHIIKDVQNDVFVNKDVNVTLTNTHEGSVSIDDNLQLSTTDLFEQLGRLTIAKNNDLSFSEDAQLFALIAQMSESQIFELLSQYPQQNGQKEIGENNIARWNLFRRYAELNPEAATLYAFSQIKNDDFYYATVADALGNLAKIDPNLALSYFEENVQLAVNPLDINNIQLEMSLVEIFNQITRQDKDLAINKLIQVTDAGYRVRNAIRGITANYTTKEDFLNLLVTTNSIDNVNVESFIIDEWARIDPKTAAFWYENEYSGEKSVGIRNKIIQNWRYSDPQAAAEWLIRTVEPANQNSELSQYLSHWAIQDPEPALIWMSKQASESIDQDVVVSLFESAAYADPYLVQKYVDASNLSEHSAKSKIAQAIYISLNRRDKNQAEAYLARSPYESDILATKKSKN